MFSYTVRMEYPYYKKIFCTAFSLFGKGYSLRHQTIIYTTGRFQLVNPMKMSNTITKNQQSPLVKIVRSFFSKLVKNPEEYPVKYYKRDKNFSKIRRS